MTSTTPARDLLPPWLVHHDCAASGVSDRSRASDDSRLQDGTTAAAAPSATPAPHSLAPPSHITLVPWDDGFTPSGCGGKPGKIVRDQVRSSPGALCVFDGAVSRATADRLYASAVRAKVWGVYVPTSELDLSVVAGTTSRRECQDATSGTSDGTAHSGISATTPTHTTSTPTHTTSTTTTTCTTNDDDDSTDTDGAGDTVETEADRQALARRAVQELLVDQASSSEPSSACVFDNGVCGRRSTRAVISAQDWANTHGVAVWVIASDCDDETEYHLDYAEMVRFETNVIVPPLYGATLHVSPLRNRDVRVRVSSDGAPTVPPGAAPASSRSSPDPVVDTDLDPSLCELDGGAFFVHSDGLAHYAQLGYKTRRLAHKRSTDELEAASGTERGWTHVPYMYRRGIVCDGEFPHFSSRVRSLPDASVLAQAQAQAQVTVAGTPGRSVSQSTLPVKRVVVGFNLFPHEIGAFVRKFPEHSAAFNRHVKLAQAAAKQIAAASAAGTSATAIGVKRDHGVSGTSRACERDEDHDSTTTATKHKATAPPPPQTWSLASVRANPKQAAFLTFLAKKMKEKGVDVASLRSASPASTVAIATGPSAATGAAETTTSAS